MHHLLERQHYKLGHWRLASSDINYRRFFDVNSLAGLRVEDAATFNAAHGLVRRLIEEGKLQGLRLDHIDGLSDPVQYFQRLSRLVRQAGGRTARSFYVVVEKILGEHEDLRPFAGVDGTTGYETLNTISRVLANQSGLDALDESWRQISNLPPELAPVLKAAKQRVLETLLTSEFTVLARLLARIAAGHYSTRDFSADSLRQALELYVLNFPIYRTYLTAAGASTEDRALISGAIEQARAEWYAADEGIFDFLRDALTMDLAKPGSVLHSAPRVRRFALKVQQFTGPLMAKSLEDTAFYRVHRLLALNEVGGEPSAAALSPDAFHQMMKTRAQVWPHALTTTATHDTKRGEDARTRLIALSELSGEWTAMVARWKVLNAPHIATSGSLRAPSATFEYMLYQTLLGAWPLASPDPSLTERLKAYAVKAAREGKQETSWLNPNEGYEASVCTFIERILDRSTSAEFVESLEQFARRVALLGALNSLSQITLKAMMPGIPDFYQGTEFWDLSMVDPDNRRPVDFDARASVLEQVERPDWQALTQDWSNGHIKLAWTRRLLTLRNEMAEVFASREYEPLASQRYPPRSRHCLRPPPRTPCGDRRSGTVPCAVLGTRPRMARRRCVRRRASYRRLLARRRTRLVQGAAGRPVQASTGRGVEGDLYRFGKAGCEKNQAICLTLFFFDKPPPVALRESGTFKTSVCWLAGTRTDNMAGGNSMSIGTIILIILVIALLGGFSGIGGGPFYGTGYYGGGGLGLIVVILLILVLLGRI